MRPTVEQVMMAVALILAQRSTCDKLAVGCVLTDSRGRILSAGYNGTPHGKLECYPDWLCRDRCMATHAESNAIISCYADREKIHTCYVNYSPCVACAKQLIQTGCKVIVHGHKSEEYDAMKIFWEGCGGQLVHVAIPDGL